VIFIGLLLVLGLVVAQRLNKLTELRAV